MSAGRTSQVPTQNRYKNAQHKGTDMWQHTGQVIVYSDRSHKLHSYILTISLKMFCVSQILILNP
jgi:hypothetical protein